jgi:hypothetical protein
MRTLSNVITRGGVALIAALAITGCGKIEPKGAREVAKPRAEAKRHRAACASSVAYDRLEGLMFDEAIGRHAGDRANLDILADYSIARIEEPVVDGWDPAIDRTRCSGRFILQLPPGAERGFGGERRLEADIHYTAQAAADGSGFVYRLDGAEPIIARLAAFNLSAGAYRPSPAIDGGQTDAAVSDDTGSDGPAPAGSIQPAPDREREAMQDLAMLADERRPVGSRGPDGEATVRRFYGALGAGDGGAASAQIIPEKRGGGAFAPDALSRFYGRLAEPIRLTRIVPLPGGAYRVSYRYSAGRSSCQGIAVVRVTNRDGRDLIRSIDALNGC